MVLMLHQKGKIWTGFKIRSSESMGPRIFFILKVLGTFGLLKSEC